MTTPRLLRLNWLHVIWLMVTLTGLAGCATETHQAIATPQVPTATLTYTGPKASVSIGKFDNRSPYARGLFSDGSDPLGAQAKTLLTTHLQQSNRFQVLDRDNLTESKREADLRGQAQQVQGARYVITGLVTDFGRKEVGDHQLFGVLGRGKTQVAYAKINLSLVNAQTSEVLYAVQGAGEYALSNREIIGFGGTSGYDATLNGKVLDLAIREAVTRLAEGMDKDWKAVP